MFGELWVVVLCDPLLDFGRAVGSRECVCTQWFGGLDDGRQFGVLDVKRLRWY